MHFYFYMKSCRTCNAVNVEFRKNKRRKDGLSTSCKECDKKKFEKYRTPEYYTKIKEYRKNNKEKINNYIKQWKETKFGSSSKYFLWYRFNNISKFRQYDKIRHRKIKIKAMNALGGTECVLCKESEIEFLTIDHINDDGIEDHKLTRRRFYHKVLSDADINKYRVLCFNCNSGRAILQKYKLESVSKHSESSQICKKCGNFKIERFSKHPKYETRIRHECIECDRKVNRQTKLNIINLLGKSCKCCGENKEHNLNVDHKHGDGHTLRRDHSTSLYRRIIKGIVDVNDFQLLCWNCNHSKYLGNGVCIHKRKE